ncbi:MAG: hypothetical protein UV02_C0013G0015 [Candidatus Kuenenbacteria bacterium GW2011_GWA2_42_15]|uniref:Uncharacterized protein n=1 Tax=Candidatus Kuenenbacteria bacterium GW2011_GWA2_42_15 TaxID=1618677 RepID=A0A0G0Z118_9BACT|nr:MAG: hypothetical protein UV02_C0013G0015 [Candidatus Kuenenbacteria bacterium GW2011_GWA2_42_15]
MANNQNKRQQQQAPVSVSFEIGQRVEMPSGETQIPVKVFTMAGDVRKPWTLLEIVVNGNVLATNAQTAAGTAEYGVMYPLPADVSTLKVSAKYYNGKTVVNTANAFAVPRPEPRKGKSATRIELGQPVFSDGMWLQSIRTVAEDDTPVEATVYMTATIETFACLNGDDTTTQQGTSFCFSIPDGLADIWVDAKRWYFGAVFSLPGGASPVKQAYLQPQNS